EREMCRMAGHAERCLLVNVRYPIEYAAVSRSVGVPGITRAQYVIEGSAHGHARVAIWRRIVHARAQLVFRVIRAHADVVRALLFQDARREFVPWQRLYF